MLRRVRVARYPVTMSRCLSRPLLPCGPRRPTGVLQPSGTALDGTRCVFLFYRGLHVYSFCEFAEKKYNILLYFSLPYYLNDTVHGNESIV